LYNQDYFDELPLYNIITIQEISLPGHLNGTYYLEWFSC